MRFTIVVLLLAGASATANTEIHLFVSGVFLGFGVAGAGINALAGQAGARLLEQIPPDCSLLAG